MAETLTPAMTMEEWSLLDEDETGELVDGRLEEEEMSGFAHEVIVAWLLSVLYAWLRPLGGFVVASDAKFVVSRRRGRKPDLSVFLPGGRVPARWGAITFPPDVMVEVVSPTPRDERRDRIEKMDDYAAFAVRYYWIVDPELRSLEIFERNAEGRYTRMLAATAGRVERVPGFSGLVLDLDEMWGEIDRLPPA